MQYTGLLGAKGVYYWRCANNELGINAFMEFTNAVLLERDRQVQFAIFTLETDYPSKTNNTS